LMLAAQRGNADAVAVLLEHGAEPISASWPDARST
jgi:hypothetical protein